MLYTLGINLCPSMFLNQILFNYGYTTLLELYIVLPFQTIFIILTTMIYVFHSCLQQNRIFFHTV